MGQIHHNELANDGRTIFMAARSTGQIKKGSAGSSIAALDGGRVSWRFWVLGQAWPCVLITSPTGRKLGTGNGNEGTLRAKVLNGTLVQTMDCRIDGEDLRPIETISGRPGLFQAAWSGSRRLIEVRARTTDGREDVDQVEPPHPGWTAPHRFADGGDKDCVGAWPAKGFLATELGPNHNDRKW